MPLEHPLMQSAPKAASSAGIRIVLYEQGGSNWLPKSTRYVTSLETTSQGVFWPVCQGRGQHFCTLISICIKYKALNVKLRE